MFGHPAWGAFCGCFEGSELLVTPAFLLAVFLSSAQPSSAPTSAQGQKGAAALLLVGGRWGERLVVGARPPSGCSEGAARVLGLIFLKFQGGAGASWQSRGCCQPASGLFPTPPLPSLFPASTSPGCPGDGADVFAREAPG